MPVNQEYFRRRTKINSNGCWIWQGSLKFNDYGQMGYKLKPAECAHRAAFEVFHFEIPKGFVVMHKCDTPACCNPEHLQLGTYSDNSKDMQAKGRQNYTNACKGSAVKHLAKLDEAKVLEIRASTFSQKELAAQYKVTYAVINKVINRKTWKHV